MLDASFIEKCADHSLTTAIVEKFVQAAGSPDPLAVTVQSGNRVILVPKPKSPDEAMDIVRRYVGQAVVRVGVTQFPAGVGIKDASELKPALVDACENLRLGTKMFAKILRIVAKWYGNPKGDETFPQIFEDAVYAWKTGEFEGMGVFQADDPGENVRIAPSLHAEEDKASTDVDPVDAQAEPPEKIESVGSADMRIDLTQIGGK